VLDFLPDQEEFHPAFAELTRRLNGYGLPQEHQLRVANALWAQQGESLLDSFVTLTRQHYGAGLRRVDFAASPTRARETINRWVAQQTQDKIKDLLKPDHIDRGTALVLTNAIYFQAAWLKPFSASTTTAGDFHIAPERTVAVPLMSQTGEFRYLDGGSFEALEMPYEGEGMALLVLLPRSADGLAKMEESLTPDGLASWLPRMKSELVAVTLPKFRVTAEFELKKSLAALGLERPFGPAADFSGMTGRKGLFLSAVVHKAYVDINEEGTEAAAATAVVMMKSGPPKALVSFRADRPFVFLVRDLPTGTILFLGRLTEPGKGE
jgi:serpin B